MFDAPRRLAIRLIGCACGSACAGRLPQERRRPSDFEAIRVSLEVLAATLDDSPWFRGRLRPDGTIGEVVAGDLLESRDVGDDAESFDSFRAARIDSVAVASDGFDAYLRASSGPSRSGRLLMRRGTPASPASRRWSRRSGRQTEAPASGRDSSRVASLGIVAEVR